MKKFAVFFVPTGYHADGSLVNEGYKNFSQCDLIKASTKAVAEKRARKILADDFDWTRCRPHNPCVVNVHVEEMTPKKARAICKLYKQQLMPHGWLAAIYELAYDSLLV